MRILILTQRMPPAQCGIGDYTRQLAAELTGSSHCVEVVCSEGAPLPGVRVAPRWWENPASIVDAIKEHRPTIILLQFTPLMYGGGSQSSRARVVHLWSRLGSYCTLGLLVHESYFREWWHFPSWIRGALEKRYLLRLASVSDYVFTASENVLALVKSELPEKKNVWLPISSNIPRVPVSRSRAKGALGIPAGAVVLTIFGGGNNVKWLARHVGAADAALVASGLRPYWLLMGGARKDWFRVRSETVQEGFLPVEEVSNRLAATDIFLMPHYSGISSKRGTLMAAIQHGLPVVGTQGPTTDSIWSRAPGIALSRRFSAAAFANNVKLFALDQTLRESGGGSNEQLFRSRFSWAEVVRRFELGVRPT